MRRTALILVVCLVSGVVVNYGVAWWYLLERIRPWSFFSANSFAVQTNRDATSWIAPVPETWPTQPRFSTESTFGLGKFTHVYQFARDQQSGANHKRRMHLLAAIEIGRPMNSLRSTIQHSYVAAPGSAPGMTQATNAQAPPAVGLQSGLRFEQDRYGRNFAQPQTWNYLPLMPLWPGFAINTLIFALVPAMVWLPLGPLKRARRRQHGRCVSCGYDLSGKAGGPCPECGNTRGDSPAEADA